MNKLYFFTHESIIQNISHFNENNLLTFNNKIINQKKNWQRSSDIMFARKKPQDFQSSLQRFTDMCRDPMSRAKHLKIILDNLNPQEKRQVIEGFSFEVYHLLNGLIFSHYDLPADPQTPVDLESALAILEQILLFAPEFIGKGWQRNGMEFIFKMILHPKNAIAVRKLAIRLFIIWYQILSVSGHSSRQLDMVFQCCLPDFPLRNGQSAEQIMTIYCEGSEPNTSATNNNFGFEPCAAKCILPEQPTSPQGQLGKLSVRERADNLQKYIDKFLEYNIRETVKINWLDPNQKLDCAKFLIDRIIVLYIYEQFPDAELNGIDVYDGWEGTFEDDENARLQDTADPIIIAKYWLIRWMINIAFGPQLLNNGHQEMVKTGGNTSISGIQLFKQALFCSRRATNILLTLIREAFRLPLACINVIQKAIELLRYWLFQEEFPNFIDSQLVSVEDWSLLLIRMLFSFFRSPYLNSVGEKLPSAVSITHSILQIVRDLANPSAVLPRPLTKKVWQELLNELIYALEFAAAKPDSFGKATAGGIARNFVSILIFIRTIRDVDIADTTMWDDLIIVLQNCVWPAQVMEQWSRIVPNLTRAMILNILKMEINTQKGSDVVDELTSQQQQFTENASSDGSRNYPLSQSRADRISNSSASTGGSSAFNAAIASLCDGMDEEERQLGIGSINITACSSIDQTSTTIADEKWLRAWMRVVCLANFIGADRPSNSPQQQLSIMQTLGRAIEMLASTGCANSLIHWLAAHLLQLENVAAEPHAIPIIFGILISSAPPPLERAYILRFLLHALRTGNSNSVPILLDHIPLISELEDMAVISTETIATLQKLVKNQEFSSRAIRVAALLSLNHIEAEKILISLLEQRQIQIDQTSYCLCVNALSLLILERADATLFDHLLNLLFNHQYASRILPIFCANIGLVVRLGFHSQLMDSLMLAQSKVKNANALNDLKWQICAINSKESITSHWSGLSEKFAASSDSFFEGFMIRLSAQFPLPGFNITQWNSLHFRPQQSTQQTTMTTEEAYNDTYMDTGGAIINLEKENPQTLWSRTCLGRHAYQIEGIQIEEEQCLPVDHWLQTLSEDQYFASQFTPSARKKSIEEIFDPFKEFPTPSLRSFASTSMAQNSSELIPLDISVPEMLQFIQASSRGPEELNLRINEEKRKEKEVANENGEQCGWRQFLTSFGLLDLAKNPPTNFQREIRHLDGTICREVHKVAIIYVGKDQQDKQTILSNTLGSDNFNKFVDALGWPVQIGSPEFFGYTGGLPNGQLAPYYATANTELIFHVSTLLAGDTTQRLKHIGNDEVHVVWSENPSKPYRRDLIATRFCDVLIVLYMVSPVLLRVHIEVQDQRIQFGPLFDGACIHTHQAASLVRETVLNASRAYRNLKVECDRPNKHREKVFEETRQRLVHLSLSASITRLFAPNTME